MPNNNHNYIFIIFKPFQLIYIYKVVGRCYGNNRRIIMCCFFRCLHLSGLVCFEAFFVLEIVILSIKQFDCCEMSRKVFAEICITGHCLFAMVTGANATNVMSFTCRSCLFICAYFWTHLKYIFVCLVNGLHPDIQNIAFTRLFIFHKLFMFVFVSLWSIKVTSVIRFWEIVSYIVKLFNVETVSSLCQMHV